ncbi:ester cyclase [Streptomyces sp. TRM66268-LWL]|uniref:Ester cyclase n=1 Tax=Streptomyces polyasparticus TaxID=2767826 RepID=A0ABR7SKE3_9ACTN|nr:ester cyclase [Streptomyces polyasparticus]MBC9715180.1 ester cyclase [Streptomyces polyasparticus]
MSHNAAPQQSAQTTERNKELFRRFHDVVNSRDAEVIDKAIQEYVDPELVFHAPVPSELSGLEAFRRVWPTLLQAFPDLQVHIQDLIAEGDKVVARNKVTGTHLGDYRGLAPTGRSVTYDEMFVLRFAEGRIAEVWGVVDVLGQLRQLGALPV